jgi:hypothetical protein
VQVKKHFVLWVLLAVISGSSRAGQHNIFDDDWVQPKSSEPRTVPATNPAPPAPAVRPAAAPPVTPDPLPTTPPTPVAPPVVFNKPPAIEAPARLPVPSKTEQAAVRKVMKDVFAKQLVDRTMKGRRKLTEALLKQADESKDAPVDRFVLLTAAVDAASEAANLPLVFKAANRLAQGYEVDGLMVKADAALRVAAKADTTASSIDNAKAVLDLTEELAAAEEFVTAVRLCTFVQPAVAQKPMLKAQVQEDLRELALARDAAARYARDVARLKAKPDDPAANLSAGRYRCFIKGDWDRGLVMLSKGSDVILESLAVQELAAPSSAEAVAKLADGWWDVSVKERDLPMRGGVMAHAVVLYKRSIGGMSGLRRAQIEKRLAEYAANPAKPLIGSTLARSSKAVELLPGMDGKCTRDEQGVVTLTRGQRISTAESFKTPVVVRIVAQTEKNNLRIAYGADQIIFNWENRGDYLRIDGGPAGGKHKRGAGAIPANTWVTIDIVVKTDSMTLSVDGEERQHVDADFSRVNQKVSIFAVDSTLMVKSVQVTQLAE